MALAINDNIRLYYEVIGSGTPIVFHHGFGNSTADWHDLGYVDALKNSYQLILIDGRGFGQSDKPTDPAQYTLSKRTADTIAVMDNIGIEQAIAYGYSMGGRTVFAMMRDYPIRFSHFIVGGMHPFSHTTKLGKDFQQWLTKGMPYVVEKIETVFSPFKSKASRQRYLQNDTQALIASYQAPVIDSSAALSNMTAPILFYCGSKDPVLANMQQAAKRIKNGQLGTIKGLDHSQAFWQADIASSMIKKFLHAHQA